MKWVRSLSSAATVCSPRTERALGGGIRIYSCTDHSRTLGSTAAVVSRLSVVPVPLFSEPQRGLGIEVYALKNKIAGQMDARPLTLLLQLLLYKMDVSRRPTPLVSQVDLCRWSELNRP